MKLPVGTISVVDLEDAIVLMYFQFNPTAVPEHNLV